ncbi:MAG: hypothetical protein RIR25_1045, partial [Verrucomicrobiota bacterium]
MTGEIAAFKKFTARTLGIRWQRGFFDHRLRHEESEREKADYILRNPGRAGLVAQWEQWPHCFMAPDAFRSLAGDDCHVAHVTRDKTLVLETHDFIKAQTRQQSSRVCARLLTIKNNLHDHFGVVFDRFIAFFEIPIATGWGSVGTVRL